MDAPLAVPPSLHTLPFPFVHSHIAAFQATEFSLPYHQPASYHPDPTSCQPEPACASLYQPVPAPPRYQHQGTHSPREQQLPLHKLPPHDATDSQLATSGEPFQASRRQPSMWGPTSATSRQPSTSGQPSTAGQPSTSTSVQPNTFTSVQTTTSTSVQPNISLLQPSAVPQPSLCGSLRASPLEPPAHHQPQQPQPLPSLQQDGQQQPPQYHQQRWQQQWQQLHQQPPPQQSHQAQWQQLQQDHQWASQGAVHREVPVAYPHGGDTPAALAPNPRRLILARHESLDASLAVTAIPEHGTGDGETVTSDSLPGAAATRPVACERGTLEAESLREGVAEEGRQGGPRSNMGGCTTSAPESIEDWDPTAALQGGDASTGATEGLPRGKEELRGTSRVHEDLELRILTERLRLLTSQRELAALHCENFTQMLEAALTQHQLQQAAQTVAPHATSQHPPQSQRQRQYAPRGAGAVVICRCASGVPQPSPRQPHQCGEASGDSAQCEQYCSQCSGLVDDEQYWSSPNFYRGRYRTGLPPPASQGYAKGTPPASGSATALGVRLPYDSYFMDSQKRKPRAPSLRNPNRHTPARHQRRASSRSPLAD